ncbi:MAG: hypothetical protein HY822_08780 [Acidobacteria bacterium]|nr:hypothetical protein [Acidobacteriota bacterium]
MDTFNQNGRPGGCWRWVAVCFFLALAYSAVRYHVFGGVPWTHLPLYTVNKAVAFSAAVLLAGICLFRPSNGVAMRTGLTATGLAVLHALMGAVMLSPSYYPKLYDAGELTLAGELGVLFGCMAFVLLAIPAIASIPSVRESLSAGRWKTSQNVKYLVLALAALHVTALGLKGWPKPDTWSGGMPPITLLSCIALLAALAAKILRNR